MGLKDRLAKQTEQLMNNNQKDVKQLTANLEHQYSELIDKVNELIKAIVSVYNVNEAICKKLEIKDLPKPLVKMEME